MKKIIALAGLLVLPLLANAYTNTLYYMENNPLRHNLNPALQPIQRVYVDLPIIPSLSFSFGNNSLKMEDVIYTKNIDGQKRTITFLHPDYGDKDRFYNKLKKTTQIATDFRFDLLQFGFRNKNGGFYSFGISQRMELYSNIPRDIFKLALYGTPDSTKVNTYNLKRMGIKAQAFAEIALGYSRKVDEKLTVGGKAKFLVGEANMNAKFKTLRLDASRERWSFDIDGAAHATVPGAEYELDEDNRPDDFDFDMDNFKMSGYGFALDLGATYKPVDHLTVSMSLIDAGFIRWRGNNINIPVEGKYEFDGIDYEVKKDNDTDYLDKYWDEIQDTVKYSANFDKYATATTAKLYIGGEYRVANDKIAFGLLSKTAFSYRHAYEDLTISTNFVPKSWFNFNLSYSLLSGQYSSVGAGLGIRAAVFYLYVASDYIPTRYIDPGIPYQAKSFNLDFGLMLTLPPKRQKKEKEKKSEAVLEEPALQEHIMPASTMQDSYSDDDLFDDENGDGEAEPDAETDAEKD